MAKSGSPLKSALYGAGIGALIGLLIIFVGFVNKVTRTTPTVREPTYEERSQAAFMAMARNDWIFKKKDANHILGYIAVVQADTATPEQSSEMDITIGRIEKDKLSPDVVRNVAVSTYLHQKVPAADKAPPEVIQAAKRIAGQIQDPLLKADALRQIAFVQARGDTEGAKKTAQEAAAAVPSPSPVYTEAPTPLFDWNMLYWPAGLLILCFLAVWCLVGLLSGMGAGRGRAVEEDEEDEEDEEEEQPRKKAKSALAAEEPPPVAEEPPPVAEEPDAALVPAEEAPMAEMPAEVPMAKEPTAVQQPQLAPGGTAARGSPLMASAAGGAPAAAGPASAGARVDKKTMMAKQAQQTMLAKQGQATMLAPKEALPTTIEQSEPMAPPGKTQKK
jgi:hypothetical protein